MSLFNRDAAGAIHTARRRLLPFIASALLLVFAAAAVAEAPAVAAAAVPAPSRLWLWKAEANGATVYVYGTIHVGTESMYPLPAPVLAALDGSSDLVLEVSPEELTRLPAIMQGRLDLILMPEGQSSLGLLSAEARTRLAELLPDRSLQAQFDKLRPWVVSTQLAMVTMALAGYDSDSGVEQWLTRQVQASGKPVGGLETAEFQFSVLAAGSAEVQAASLDRALRDWDSTKAELEELISAWRSGNASALAAQFQRGRAKASPEENALEAALIEGRNRTMTEGIRALLAKGGTHFVAIGSGHVVGPEGIPALLAAAGCTVTPVE